MHHSMNIFMIWFCEVRNSILHIILDDDHKDATLWLLNHPSYDLQNDYNLVQVGNRTSAIKSELGASKKP